jgi:hypothetical protein
MSSSKIEPILQSRLRGNESTDAALPGGEHTLLLSLIYSTNAFTHVTVKATAVDIAIVTTALSSKA